MVHKAVRRTCFILLLSCGTLAILPSGLSTPARAQSNAATEAAQSAAPEPIDKEAPATDTPRPAPPKVKTVTPAEPAQRENAATTTAPAPTTPATTTPATTKPATTAPATTTPVFEEADAEDKAPVPAADAGTGTGTGAEDTASASPTATADQEPEKKPAAPPASLTIAGWGGAYGEAIKQAVLAPYAQRTGIRLDTIEHEGGRILVAEEKSTSVLWDIAHVPGAVARAACEAGTVQPLKLTTEATDGIDPSALGRCHVATSTWASVIAVSSKAISRRWPEPPSSLSDLFDTDRFPGKRALPDQPRYVLELALMADGVAPAAVYETLSQDAGIRRALARLETIRDDIVWWQSARAPIALLRDDEVAFALAFNGRLFSAFAGRAEPPKMIWDGQVYAENAWVIPRASRHAEAAAEFIAYAASVDAMTRQARLLPYGPTRIAAARQVTTHESTGADITAFLPTHPGNTSRRLRTDDAWWDANRGRVMTQFSAWRAGKSPSDDAAPAAETTGDTSVD